MLSFETPGRTRLCDSWSRREIVRVGGLSALGFDPHATMFPTPEGREVPLSDGTPIHELL